MVEVSEAWKAMNQRFLLPETFVEISCFLTAEGVQNEAIPSGTNEAIFSDVDSVMGFSGVQMKKYATFESNLWALDGTRDILESTADDVQPSPGFYPNVGYVSDIANTGSVMLRMYRAHTPSIPGVTITWSSEYGEYATVFTVTAKNGDEIIAETTVTDNTSNRSVVYMEVKDYRDIIVTVHAWSIPDHRPRIDLVKMGLDLTFTKRDILSYSHEQSGCLVSGELPKNQIEFSLDNTDNRWNPNNPVGLEKYLSERQRLTVRYGMDVGGMTEWIKAGTFYLSEWRAPSNGLEAHFVARDIFEFLIGAGGIGAAVYDTLGGLIDYAVRAYLPEGSSIAIDPVLENYSAGYIGDTSHAGSVQKCANAGGCIIRYDREGVLHVEPLNTQLSDYVITSALSYSYPEVELSKPLRSVAVSYKDSITPYVLEVSELGEQQTVDNDYITSEEQAAEVAAWVRDMLEHRRNISGEFRADPRLDLFDVVQVETKYGVVSPVVITNIKYTYSGSFRGSFTGRALA
jgi:hypothetical protein